MTPTPFQQSLLAIIDTINASVFSGWFQRSSVMATCQVESAFRPQAYRFEPALGEASYGLMQTLESTARALGWVGVDPKALYDPATSLRWGMACHYQDWAVLSKRFGRDPTIDEWADAYNRGARGSMLGSYDHAYVLLWEQARKLWLPFDIAQAAVRPEQTVPSDIRPVLRLTDPPMTGDDVSELQRGLAAALGYVIAVDDVFGVQTDNALRAYQGDRGLTVDGIAGPQVWTALEKERA